jgi:hypothetical protein
MKYTVRERGGGAAIHGNSGRHPANLTDEAARVKTTALKKSDAYRKADFTCLGKLPAEYEQITLRGILKRLGPLNRIWGSQAL